MSCPRCSGLLIVERYVEMYGDLHYLKCLNCGAVRDARIEAHQRRPPQRKHSDPRTSQPIPCRAR
jgi:hypothetical protein